MPTKEYQCNQCEARFDVQECCAPQGDLEDKCPFCGSTDVGEVTLSQGRRDFLRRMVRYT